MTTAIDLIRDERIRQIEVEGWSAKHDDGQTRGELAFAAAHYSLPDDYEFDYGVQYLWPWVDGESYDKKAEHNRVRQLVIAGALICAEIDRLNRAVIAMDAMETEAHGEVLDSQEQ